MGEGEGGLINFPPLKRGGLLEREGLFERGGLIEDLWYLKMSKYSFLSKKLSEVTLLPKSIKAIAFQITYNLVRCIKINRPKPLWLRSSNSIA